MDMYFCLPVQTSGCVWRVTGSGEGIGRCLNMRSFFGSRASLRPSYPASSVAGRGGHGFDMGFSDLKFTMDRSCCKDRFIPPIADDNDHPPRGTRFMK